MNTASTSKSSSIVPTGELLAAMSQLAIAKLVLCEEFKDPKCCIFSLPNETDGYNYRMPERKKPLPVYMYVCMYMCVYIYLEPSST